MKKTLQLLAFMLILPFISCENEPMGEINYSTDFIFVDSELYDLIKRVTEPDSSEGISCIEFSYSFAIFVFDSNQVFLRVEGVNNNEEFVFLLENLEDGESISLNYPISGRTTNGDLIEINTNDELKEAIENCVRDEIINDCNGALCEAQCAWVITEFSNTYFEGAYINHNIDGAVNLYHASNVYFGTWITYFSGDQLYLNLQFIDDGDVAEAFNFEWELDYSSNEFMTLTAGEQTLSIGIDCELPCFEEYYTQCEIEGNQGIANFSLQQFILCFGNNYRNSNNRPLEFTFYETADDAQSGDNQLSPTSYTNIENPQAIYFRAFEMETGDTTGFGSFNIKAIPCD
jgi:hypothetical protein